MFPNRGFGREELLIVLWLAGGPLTVAQGQPVPACSAPPALEAQLRTHPSENGYAALAVWFDQNHQPECAAETIRASLKIAPGSARLHHLLGQNLYLAGRYREAVAPLEEAIQIDPGALPPHVLLGATLARWAAIATRFNNGRQR